MNFQPVSPENPLILASASPRRKRLLKQIGLPFRSVPSHIDENQVFAEPALNPALLAEKKARAVQSISRPYWVLGADTMVLMGEKILGKPKDEEDARSMLMQLGGKEHRVITGFCLLDPSNKTAHREEITTFVTMKSLTGHEIKAYIATGEPFGKAGAYGIQGKGAFMVEAISGSYTNVVGLPICALVKALVAAGALKEFPFASQGSK
jgi:septum formation protein